MNFLSPVKAGPQSNLRRKVERAYRKLRAILILTNSVRNPRRQYIDLEQKVLPTLPRSQLQVIYAKMQKDLKYLETFYGVSGTLDELEEPLRQAIPRGSILYIDKPTLEKLFARYDRSSKEFPLLPPHARIGIDIHGIVPESFTPEYALLQATLFEEMALLWNSLLEAQKAPDTKLNIKRRNAFMRSTARAVYHLLEGYLNGLANDILLTNESLTSPQRILLAEYDPEKKRPRFFTLREKLLQYPKIALGRAYPVLQENNSEAMRMILEFEDRVRNALVHPSVKVDPRGDWAREAVFFQLDTELVRSIVDSGVALIKQINQELNGKFGSVRIWIHDRDASGPFPDAAFA